MAGAAQLVEHNGFYKNVVFQNYFAQPRKRALRWTVTREG